MNGLLPMLSKHKWIVADKYLTWWLVLSRLYICSLTLTNTQNQHIHTRIQCYCHLLNRNNRIYLEHRCAKTMVAVMAFVYSLICSRCATNENKMSKWNGQYTEYYMVSWTWREQTHTRGLSKEEITLRTTNKNKYFAMTIEHKCPINSTSGCVALLLELLCVFM